MQPFLLLPQCAEDWYFKALTSTGEAHSTSFTNQDKLDSDVHCQLVNLEDTLGHTVSGTLGIWVLQVLEVSVELRITLCTTCSTVRAGHNKPAHWQNRGKLVPSFPQVVNTLSEAKYSQMGEK